MRALQWLLRRLEFLDGRRLLVFRLVLGLAFLLAGWGFYLQIYWDLVNWHSPDVREDFFELLPLLLRWTATMASVPLVASIRPCRLTLFILIAWAAYSVLQIAVNFPSAADWGPYSYLRWDIVRASWAYGLSIVVACAIVLVAWFRRRQGKQDLAKTFGD